MERKSFQSRDRGQVRDWGQRGDRDSYRGCGLDKKPQREPQKMYKAKHSEHCQEIKVPFKPDPDRPVYCRECYAKRKSRKV